MNYIKMDYSLSTPEERTEKVKEIIANTPPQRLTPKYLDKLAEYILCTSEKQEKTQEKRITSNNRKATRKIRETSFEGLVGKLENGEDGIYNMIANDKNIIFRPKSPITEADLAEIPALNELHQEIKRVEEQLKAASGKQAYALGKQLVAMRQDQYIIRAAYKKPIYSMNLIKSFSKIDLSENITVDEETGEVRNSSLINLFDEKHVSILLCNYCRLKQETWDKVEGDAKWLIADLEELIERTLKDKYPLYYSLLIYKMDGLCNNEIQARLTAEFGTTHSIEYISSLWRNKIPRLIAQAAENEYLIWYYTNVKKGKWKRCSRCGEIKLAHNNFFSKNKTSKDNWYSICKCCRNLKEEDAADGGLLLHEV